MIFIGVFFLLLGVGLITAGVVGLLEWRKTPPPPPKAEPSGRVHYLIGSNRGRFRG
jgi:hypothetical protein